MAFIKLDREFFNNKLWNEEREFSKVEALLDLIQSARFETSNELISGKTIELQKNEIPISRRFLEKRWKWGSSKVTNFIKMLVQTEVCTTKQTNGQTILTLIKLKVSDDLQTTKQTTKQTTNKPPANQNKEYKELKEREDEEEKEENPTSSIFDSDSFYPITTLKAELLKNQMKCKAIINHKPNKFKDFEHLKTRLKDFEEFLNGGGTLMKEGTDFCKHFRSWHLKTFQTQGATSEDTDKFYSQIPLV